MIRLWCARWVLVVPLIMMWLHGVSVFGQVPSRSALADRVEVPSDGTIVPMDDLSGRPLVSVWINGRGPYLFVVGTSAPMTALTQDLINELGLTPDTDQLGSGPITIDELRVGDAVVRAVPVGRAVLETSPDEPGVRGILSAASFPGVLLALDYSGAKLRLQPGALPAADGRRVFQFPADEAAPTVPVDIGGRLFDVLVDSNAPGGLTLPTRDAGDLPLADDPVEIGRVVDLVGSLPVSVATVNGIVTIGDLPLDIHSVVFCDVRSALGTTAGSVGARVLEGFVVTLDAKNHRIRLDR